MYSRADSRPRNHIRAIRARHRVALHTYVKSSLIIVAPKKHKTHGLSVLDDVGFENGNKRPVDSGACDGRPVQHADWSLTISRKCAMRCFPQGRAKICRLMKTSLNCIRGDFSRILLIAKQRARAAAHNIVELIVIRLINKMNRDVDRQFKCGCFIDDRMDTCRN